MKTVTDHFRTRYKRRNKNVLVTKKVDDYLLGLTKSRLDAALARDYEKITNMPDGSYQTPLNQLEYIALLARISGTKTILEVGTFKGFTALYLAKQLGPEVRIVTCELVPEHIKIAQKLWKKHGVAEQIELLAGDAAQSLAALRRRFDLIYIDADKKGYPHYYQQAQRLCKKGGLILLDNMLWAGLVAHEKTGYSHATLLGKLNHDIYAQPQAPVALLPAWDGVLAVIND